MIFRVVAIINVLLLVSLYPALAQEAPPCTRGSTSGKMGGIDLDAMRCQMAIIEQQRNNALDAAAGNQATVMMNQGDLAAARDQATATKAWLDQSWKEMEYWRAFAGYDPKHAETPVAPAPTKE